MAPVRFLPHLLPMTLPLTAALLCVAAPAQQASDRGIYVCVDEHGRRVTSDRLIPECMMREQRVLNRDGSLRRVIPPSMTADERAAVEAKERRIAAEQAAQQEAVRRDRNLLSRYANEAVHQKAREAALDDLRGAMKVSEERLRDLAIERKPLVEETDFYKGRALPPKLKQQIDANDAATQAQRELIANQEAELGRVNALYDAELARLKKLWAGAAPGSLGPLKGSEQVKK
jgi:muconolactone delta-isomerase